MKNIKQNVFIDYASIKIKSGNGGNGGKFFHKEKYKELGGPSGGNGGNGGSIFLVASKNENTLLNLKNKIKFYAENGQNGFKQNMTGKSGKDLYINVPLGTEVKINSKKNIDLVFDNQMFLIQKGGRGGRGNSSFKSSKNTAPTIFELGEKTKEIELNLNLKLLADVGILGYPNVGKSTFISTISNAKPKIANYDFTTLNPVLGIVKKYNKIFTIVDLPGLIDGASKNKGMGATFLKHLSRCKLILHFLDGTKDSKDVKKNYENIRNELNSFSKKLFNLPEIIVITKNDNFEIKKVESIRKEFKNNKIISISSIEKNNIDILIRKILEKLEDIKKESLKIINEGKEDFIYIKYENEIKDMEDIKIKKMENNKWLISGKYIEYWANRIPFESEENIFRLIQKMKSKKIIEKLEMEGLKENDILMIENSPFIFSWK